MKWKIPPTRFTSDVTKLDKSDKCNKFHKSRNFDKCDSDLHEKQNLFAELEYCLYNKFNFVSEIAQVHNLVGTCKVECDIMPLDLQEISRFMPNTRFEKQKFAAITIRLAYPNCTVLLFTSGKMVLTGCKSYIDCLAANNNILNLLRIHNPGMQFFIQPLKIQNIVGNADVNLKEDEFLDLKSFYRDYNIYCTYQPTMFPGLIYRSNQLNIVLLVFFSGRVVITGAKCMSDVFEGWKNVHDLVCSYKRSRV